MDTPSPIKDRLYQIIQSIPESIIQEKIAESPESLMQEIFSKTDIDSLDGNKTENYETLAESLMHFILTNALIPSQRKITIEQTELDIVIPDIRTLRTSNKDAIVILFPKTENVKSILQRLEKILSIQPIKENIWLVQKSSLGLPYKTYEIGDSNSFFHIIRDIKNAIVGKGQSKFKIFKV
ncbi:MAG: hypothetical protein FJ357_05460 [Thaumarchaeota archaeon]|nr:hypothetical protein [Nitrososphaerota archaeon]